ncbi:hypothetical protein DQG13_16155 [Paenibacillus sp. YN15]|nr:hypothetical protein DQG13_16155 [Paenibacillus sp. YN15]
MFFFKAGFPAGNLAASEAGLFCKFCGLMMAGEKFRWLRTENPLFFAFDPSADFRGHTIRYFASGTGEPPVFHT